MSAPPPGYNPGDSLLQGGNAPIHAVQGGGGLGGGAVAPEDQSLLNGGNSAEIHPVQGGGALEDILAEIQAELQSLGAEAPSPEVEEKRRELTELLEKGPMIKIWLETPLTKEPDPPDPARQQKGETGWAYWQRAGKGVDEADNPGDAFPMEQFLSRAFLGKLGKEPPPSGAPPPPLQQAIQQPGLQLGEADLERLNALLASFGISGSSGETVAVAAVRRQKALGSIEAKSSSVDLPTRPAISDHSKRFTTLTKAYIQKQSGLWKRKTVGTVTAPAAAQRITNERCPPIRSVSVDEMSGAAASEDLGGFDRLVTFLPKTLQRIFLYPAIQGDVQLLGRCIAHTQTTSLGANDALIFRAPLFGTASAPNKTIFANLLHLKANSPAWVYFPPEHTSLNRLNGCQLDPNYDRGAQLGTDPIPNFLEPSYLILSHPALEFNTQPKKGILLTTANLGGNLLPTSKAEGGTPYASVESLIKAGQDNGSFCIVTNLDGVDSSAGEMEVVSLRDMGPGNKRIDVLYLARTDKVSSLDAIVRELPNQFQASRSITPQESALSTKVVTLGTKQYKLRDPGMEGVYDDWVRLEFTEDESNFLMDLNLRPKMLATIFKGETDPVTRLPLRWQEILAGFMRNILDSDCFTDDTLLTVGECQQGRKFVNRILQYFMEHDQEIADLSDTELARLQKMLVNRVDEADTLAQMRALQAEQERLRALTAESGEQAARGAAAAAEAAGDAQARAAQAALAATFGGPAKPAVDKDPYKDGVVKFDDDILDKTIYFDEVVNVGSKEIGDKRPSRILKASSLTEKWSTVDEAIAKLTTAYPNYEFSK